MCSSFLCIRVEGWDTVCSRWRRSARQEERLRRRHEGKQQACMPCCRQNVHLLRKGKREDGMQTRTEGGVDVGEKMADAVGGLEHGEHEQQHVQNCSSVDEAPEQGVRPAEYRVPEVGHSVSAVSVTCRNCGSITWRDASATMLTTKSRWRRL